MARCSYCGRETELHQGGVPTCAVCCEWLASEKLIARSAHSRLVEDLAEAKAQLDSVTRTHDQVIGDIPSGLPHPDGAQRIHSISHELSIDQERLARAHSRLADFLDRGIVPEDLLWD